MKAQALDYAKELTLKYNDEMPMLLQCFSWSKKKKRENNLLPEKEMPLVLG